eukprot:CAMPEP_0197389146 /NCGR_PEP_ID=MMETSP1165-20131217/1489_1 /TAXON_ID=284809 /ORGANISM="Chrysocystis fragilis, Strain CCMP3189" /LENGTH=95 /DNA_ID=CAMNT_0042914527 /DNA_START=337 /DNA_END=624 /DNA_ORIENTATION=-
MFVIIWTDKREDAAETCGVRLEWHREGRRRGREGASELAWIGAFTAPEALKQEVSEGEVSSSARETTRRRDRDLRAVWASRVRSPGTGYLFPEAA